MKCLLLYVRAFREKCFIYFIEYWINWKCNLIDVCGKLKNGRFECGVAGRIAEWYVERV